MMQVIQLVKRKFKIDRSMQLFTWLLASLQRPRRHYRFLRDKQYFLEVTG